MTHSEKVEAARRQLTGSGVAESNWAPPLWKLMWWMGLEVPPPPFLGFWRNALLMGGLCAASFWGLMWFGLWSRQGMPAWTAVLLAVAGGSLFGVFMALYHRRMARKHRLPAWSDYAGDSAPDGRPVP